MRGTRVGAIALIVVLVVGLLSGCASGGDGPATATAQQTLAKGQSELESVTTNLNMNPDSATTTLRSSAREFASVLQQDPNNTQAKFGYALSNTLIGFYDLISVLPKNMKAPLLSAITAARSRAPQSPAISLALLAETALKTDSRATIRDVQLRIASRTLEGTKSVLPLYDQLETAANSGDTIYLRLYEGGRIRTVSFGKADVQLLGAFAYGVTALLNASVAYNLEMSGGTPLRALPVDTNNNGMFEASEYLIAHPFLSKSSGAYMTYFLNYLRQACDKATAGSSLQGHSSGANAFLDLTKPATVQMLDRLSYYSSAIAIACSATVSTDRVFGDHVVRSVDLAKITQVSDLRNLLPSFQKDDLAAPGIWPDTTFGGVFTPGIPQGFITLHYSDFERAY